MNQKNILLLMLVALSLMLSGCINKDSSLFLSALGTQTNCGDGVCADISGCNIGDGPEKCLNINVGDDCNLIGCTWNKEDFCSGNPDCSSLDTQECSTIGGCLIDESCNGPSSTSCDSYLDEPSCKNGCFWEIGKGICGGTSNINSCSELLDQEQCGNNNCMWSEGKSAMCNDGGTTKSCSDFDGVEESCGKFNECSWDKTLQECTGQMAINCQNYYFDQTVCELASCKFVPLVPSSCDGGAVSIDCLNVEAKSCEILDCTLTPGQDSCKGDVDCNLPNDETSCNDLGCSWKSNCIGNIDCGALNTTVCEGYGCNIIQQGCSGNVNLPSKFNDPNTCILAGYDWTGEPIENENNCPEDCDGENPSEEICNDGLDNDGDGNIDCLDSDCDGEKGPETVNCEFETETICDDGADNDGDGSEDCKDDYCGGQVCGVAFTCMNGACVEDQKTPECKGDSVVGCNGIDLKNCANSYRKDGFQCGEKDGKCSVIVECDVPQQGAECGNGAVEDGEQCEPNVLECEDGFDCENCHCVEQKILECAGEATTDCTLYNGDEGSCNNVYFVNGVNQQCEYDSNVDKCSAGAECKVIQQGVECGNGAVEDGEQCEPNVLECEDGFDCENCHCVEQKILECAGEATTDCTLYNGDEGSCNNVYFADKMNQQCEYDIELNICEQSKIDCNVEGQLIECSGTLTNTCEEIDLIECSEFYVEGWQCGESKGICSVINQCQIIQIEPICGNGICEEGEDKDCTIDCKQFEIIDYNDVELCMKSIDHDQFMFNIDNCSSDECVIELKQQYEILIESCTLNETVSVCGDNVCDGFETTDSCQSDCSKNDVKELLITKYVEDGVRFDETNNFIENVEVYEMPLDNAIITGGEFDPITITTKDSSIACKPNTDCSVIVAITNNLDVPTQIKFGLRFSDEYDAEVLDVSASMDTYEGTVEISDDAKIKSNGEIKEEFFANDIDSNHFGPGVTKLYEVTFIVSNVWNMKYDIIAENSFGQELVQDPIITSFPYYVSAGEIVTLNQSWSVDGTAIIFNGTGSELKCDGNTLTGNGTGNGIEIISYGSNTVNDCKVTGFVTGIEIQDDSNHVEGNYIYDNNIGISLDSADNNVLINNEVYENSQGIYLVSSSNNIMSGDVFTQNGEHGINIESTSTGNNFTNISSCDNNQDDSTYYDFNDLNGADNTYLSSTYDTSNLGNPIYFDQFATCSGTPFPSCVNLSDSNTYQNKVHGDMSTGFTVNDSITLCTDTYQINVTALTVDADNIAIDCNGATLNGNGASSTLGIYNRYYDYVNVTNCNVAEYVYGIRYRNVDNGYVTGNTVTSNIQHGFYIQSSSNIILTNNIATLNTREGFYLSSSSNNILTDNIATLNTREGFYLSSSSNNTLTDNIATFNTRCGIYLRVSIANTLINNIATSNTLSGIYLRRSSDGHILINNSVTSNTQYGIYFSSSSNNIVLNNTATSNTRHGVYFTSSSNNNFTNNVATFNIQRGISLRSSSTNSFTNNTVTFNTLGGIYVRESEDNIFTNNTVSNNYRDGIYLTSNSPGNNFTNTKSCNNNQAGGSYSDFNDLTSLENSYSSSIYDTTIPDDQTYFDWIGGCTELNCTDAIDNDGDGYVDCLDSDCNGIDTCEYDSELTCTDTIDNDGDSYVDCLDSDCDGIGTCEYDSELTCTDTIDNDGDTYIDCLDSDCNGVDTCEYDSELTCNDLIDNDGDSYVDCLDSDCDGIDTCEYDSELTCTDTIDNDADSYVDCLDSDCDGVGTCEYDLELTCNDSIDNDGDSYVDCLDSDCDGIDTCEYDLELTCNDTIDNDGDGDIDCLDLDCNGTSNCEYNLELTCNDGLDNDGDGDIDCADLNCSTDSVCVSSDNNDDDSNDNGCRWDSDCNDNELCNSDGECEALECGECGYIENHECVGYDCCFDNDCSDDEECYNNECVKIGDVVIEFSYEIIDCNKGLYDIKLSFINVETNEGIGDFVYIVDDEMSTSVLHEGMTDTEGNILLSNVKENLRYQVMFGDYGGVFIGDFSLPKCSINELDYSFCSAGVCNEDEDCITCSDDCGNCDADNSKDQTDMNLDYVEKIMEDAVITDQSFVEEIKIAVEKINDLAKLDPESAAKHSKETKEKVESAIETGIILIELDVDDDVIVKPEGTDDMIYAFIGVASLVVLVGLYFFFILGKKKTKKEKTLTKQSSKTTKKSTKKQVKKIKKSTKKVVKKTKKSTKKTVKKTTKKTKTSKKGKR